MTLRSKLNEQLAKTRVQVIKSPKENKKVDKFEYSLHSLLFF